MDEPKMEQRDSQKLADKWQCQFATVMGTISMSVFGTMMGGAYLDAPWASAVVACCLCFMGVVVAYFMRRV